MREEVGGPNISKGICNVMPVSVPQVEPPVGAQFENGKMLPMGTTRFLIPLAVSAVRPTESPPNVGGHGPIPEESLCSGTLIPWTRTVITWPGAAVIAAGNW